jgi:hypothetical protein
MTDSKHHHHHHHNHHHHHHHHNFHHHSGPDASMTEPLMSVWIDNDCFRLPIGDGKQPLRWLVIAAIQCRLSTQRGNGFVRTREIGGDTDDLLGCISHVTAVWSDDYIGPDISIKDVKLRFLEKGGVDAVRSGIRIHFVPKPPPMGGRIPNSATIKTPLWHSLAFHFSTEGLSHAEKELAIFKSDKEKLLAEEEAKRAVQLQKEMVELSRMLVSDVEDPDLIDNNFIYDMSNVRLDSVTNAEELQRTIKRLLKQHYVAILDLFRHFSGGSSKGSIASVQRNELVHLLSSAKAFDMIKERPMLDAAFAKANAGRDSGDANIANDNDENSLARYEFLEFLVLFSNDKLGREVDMRSGQINGPANALYKVINEFLIPLHTKLNSGPVRAALKEESVHQFLLPRLPQLMKVYQYYASLDGEDTPPPPSGKKLAAKKKASLMDLDEFILLLEHSGLLDDVTIMKTNAKESSASQLKNAKATLTAQEVRETFSGVMRDEAAPTSGEGAVTKNKDDEEEEEGDEEELTFGEFLEAIGRIAIAKWGDAVGLRFVLDPRQNAMRGGAAAGQGADKVSAELILKHEKVFVRSLIMWAYFAIANVSAHLGSGVLSPVHFDTNELARIVTMGISDVVAAATSCGSSAAVFQCISDGKLDEQAAAEKATGPGVKIYATHHGKSKAKNPFGGVVIKA